MGAVVSHDGQERDHRPPVDFHRVAQRHTLDILLGNEMERAIVSDLMNGDDVRMIQSRGTASLLLETTQPFAVFGEVSWQQFERHLAT